MHYASATQDPRFTDAAIDNESIVVVNGVSSTLSFAAYGGVDGLQALNSTIMATSVQNDYVTDSTIGAETDWVLTFPTKTFHVTPDPAVEPFNYRWNGQTACEPSSLASVDREESTPPPTVVSGGGVDLSPAPPSTPGTPPGNDDVNLCYEASIVQFGGPVLQRLRQIALPSAYLRCLTPVMDGRHSRSIRLLPLQLSPAHVRSLVQVPITPQRL